MIVARWPGAPGKPTVLLYGHDDVPPPEPLEAWTTRSFEPTIRDGQVFARGVADSALGRELRERRLCQPSAE